MENNQQKRVTETVSIEGAQLAFRNFSGRAGRLNQEGNRNFCVLLNDEIANDMAKAGWNVKYLDPRNEDEAPQAFIQVSLSWNEQYPQYDPKIYMITNHGKAKVSESEVSNLDWAEIENVDLIIRPYNWSMPNGKSGVKAKLKSMYVTVREDEFESKYCDVPDSAANTMTFASVQKN